MFYLFRQETDLNRSQGTNLLAEGIEFRGGQVAISWVRLLPQSISAYGRLSIALEAAQLRYGGEPMLCWAGEEAITPEEAKHDAEAELKRIAALYRQAPPLYDKSWFQEKG